MIQTIESKDTPLSKLSQAQKSVLWNISTSIVTLLTSLAEAQDEIVQAITKQSIFGNFLFGLLATEAVPVEIQSEATLCLQTLTEDNEELSQVLVNERDRLELLMNIKDSGDLKGVAACGVLHNVFSSLHWFDSKTPVPGASDAILIPSLTKYLDQGNNLAKGSNGHAAETDPEQVLQLALEITASIATTLQEALEQGERHGDEFEGLDDKDDKDDVGEEDDEMDDMEQEDDNGEMNDEEIDEDMELVTRDYADDDDAADQPTLERLVQDAAPRIIKIAQSSRGPSPEHKAIQTHALSALNNISWTVSSIDFSTGDLDKLQSSWASVRQRIWDEIVSPVLASDTADISLATSITSIAWAVSRGAQGSLKFLHGEQQKFIALFHASKALDNKSVAQAGASKKAGTEEEIDQFQGLGVKCIGVLGRLAMDPAPIELNREIGAFLINIVSALPDTPAANVIEALDQIFDIYGDEGYSYDQAVFWKEGFYAQLEEVLPKVRQMAKSIDKRKHAELRLRADEAVLNLGRFLKYKRTKKAT